MKISRLFTIDVELAERLKNSSNQSELVNRLLKEYFDVSGDKNTIFEQKKAVFDSLKKKMRDTKKEINIFSQFQSLKLDRFCIRWIKGQQQEPTIFSIRDYSRSRSLSIPSENFIKGWKLIKQHGHLFEEY